MKKLLIITLIVSIASVTGCARRNQISGGLRGGAATKRERIRVIKNCLRNRGYQVLN